MLQTFRFMTPGQAVPSSMERAGHQQAIQRAARDTILVHRACNVMFRTLARAVLHDVVTRSRA